MWCVWWGGFGRRAGRSWCAAAAPLALPDSLDDLVLERDAEPYELGHDSNGTTLDIGRGNWGQGSGGEPLNRPKWYARITIPGRALVHPQPHGQTPQMPSVPADTVYPGEIPWNERLKINLPAAGIGPGEYEFLIEYFAASYFDFNSPPKWEWGNVMAGDGSRAQQRRTFTVTAAAPPPPPGGTALANVEAALVLLAEARDQLRA